MYKKSFLAVIALLSAAFTSCSNESVETVGNVEEQQVLVPVTVHVSDFSVSQEELGTPSLTRATEDAAAYAGIKELTLAFYTGDGTQQYKVKQVKTILPLSIFHDLSRRRLTGRLKLAVLRHSLLETSLPYISSCR